MTRASTLLLLFACARPAPPPITNAAGPRTSIIESHRCKTFGERIGRYGPEAGMAKRTLELIEICNQGLISKASIECAHDRHVNDVINCVDRAADKTDDQAARWRKVWDDWYY